MSAPRRALLSLAPLALLGAAPAETGPHSLIVGRWLDDRIVEIPPCPEPATCAGEIRDVRLVDVDTLSGPAVPRRLTVRLATVLIRPQREDYQAILIVRPDGAGRPWAGRRLQSAMPGRDACIRSGWFAMLDLPPPRRAYRRGEQTCFPAA
ncbi:MAG TPA: hypothetical protein VJS15_00455 [Allosphingosinicella sp.]|nr:hypothetical protein [Allosphingosinicella sp.]